MSAESVAAPAQHGKRRSRRRVRWGAALLSLVFPGVGQVYAGAVRRGIVIAAAAALWGALYHFSPYAAAAAPRIAAPFVLLLLPLGAVIAFGAAIDAFLAAKRHPREGLPWRRRWLAYAALVVVPSLPGIAARLDWAHYVVPSGSMVPSLLVGDHVLAIDGYYRVFAPRRGDLVAFHARGVLFIKRLIGLPGDRVEMQNGLLIIDGGQAPLEPLAAYPGTLPACRPGLYPQYLETLPGGSRHRIVLECGPGTLRDTAPLTVPDGHYFMLGDNRDNSEDSRDPEAGTGLVPADDLVARAIFIAYSLDGAEHWLGLPFAVRWQRIARALG